MENVARDSRRSFQMKLSPPMRSMHLTSSSPSFKTPEENCKLQRDFYMQRNLLNIWTAHFLENVARGDEALMNVSLAPAMRNAHLQDLPRVKSQPD